MDWRKECRVRRVPACVAGCCNFGYMEPLIFKYVKGSTRPGNTTETYIEAILENVEWEKNKRSLLNNRYMFTDSENKRITESCRKCHMKYCKDVDRISELEKELKDKDATPQIKFLGRKILSLNGKIASLESIISDKENDIRDGVYVEPPEGTTCYDCGFSDKGMRCHCIDNKNKYVANDINDKCEHFLYKPKPYPHAEINELKSKCEELTGLLNLIKDFGNKIS